MPMHVSRSDPVKFVERLRAALKSYRSAKSETLIHDEVN